jgi:hypothetical protein
MKLRNYLNRLKTRTAVTIREFSELLDGVVLKDEIAAISGGGSGSPGPQGPPGADGADGSTWYNGTGAPSSALGANGDYYLNNATDEVYFKASGSWSIITTIKGDPGVGVPPGGTIGQILSKSDIPDYETEWIDNFTSQVKHIVKAAQAINKGQAVYVSAANGTNMIVSKASNASESTSSRTLGLMAGNVITNGFEYAITEGLLAGIDTSSANAGDPVYLGTNGNLIFGVANKPIAPAHMVSIGVVTRAQQNNGEIFVRIVNGFEIEELHNVLISALADSDLLQYESASQLWKNKTLAEVIIASLGGDGTSGQLIQTNGAGVLSWVNNGGNRANQYIKAVTGTTITGPQGTVTTMISLLIPANTFGSGSVFRIVSRSRRVTAVGANTNIRIVINSTNSPTAGTPTIIASGILGSGAQPGSIARTLSINGTTTTIPQIGIGSAANDDEAFGITFSQVTNIDWTVNQYVILGGTAASGESQVPESLTITPL